MLIFVSTPALVEVRWSTGSLVVLDRGLREDSDGHLRSNRVAQKCKKSWNQAFVLILHTQHLPKHRNMNIFHFKAFYAERRPLEGNSF